MKQKNKKKMWCGLSALSFGVILCSTALPLVNNTNNVANPITNVTKLTNATNEISPRAESDVTSVSPLISATGSLSSLYPAQLIINSNYDNDLKKLIIANVSNVAGNGELRLEDINIVKDRCTTNNLTGEISVYFEIKNFKAKIVSSTGAIQTVSVQGYNTKINAMLIATPSKIPTAGQTVAAPDEYKGYTITNIVHSNILQTRVLPALVGGTQLPGSFSIEVTNNSYVYPDTLRVSAIFNNYFSSTGEFVINNFKSVNFEISGFKPLENTSINQSIDASSLNIFANEVTLNNAFPLIQSNILNPSRVLTIGDIKNFTVESNLVESTARLNFEITQDIWVENAVIPTKQLSITFTNFNKYQGTCINNVVDTGVSGFTSAELRDSSPDGNWEINTTLKSILASNIANYVGDAPLEPIDIVVNNVQEQDPIYGGSYNKLLVDFTLINSKAKDQQGNILPSLNLQTTITGFKKTLDTTINSEIVAKYPDTNKTGKTVLNNIFANQASDLQIKTIIANSFNQSVKNIDYSDIAITAKTVDISAGTIEVGFDLIHDRYVDGNGVSQPSHSFSTKIFGFKLFTGETNTGLLTNNKIITNTSLTQPFVVTANYFDSRPEILNSVVRSFVSGPVPNNFRIEISNLVSDLDQKKVTFDATLYNVYKNDGTIENRAFTGLQITDLPENSPKVTWTLPFLDVPTLMNEKVPTGEDSKVTTIEDLRPNKTKPETLWYEPMQKMIANIKATQNASTSLNATDIKIIEDSTYPKYDVIKNTVTAKYIIQNKYVDEKGTVGNSPEKIVTFTGFKPIETIKTSAYAIKAIPGVDFSKVYASDIAAQINEIRTITGITQQERLDNIQIILSKYVSFNTSNLNPENTEISINANNTDTQGGNITGSLLVNLTSSRYYNSTGEYKADPQNVATNTIYGFAPISGANIETDVITKINVDQIQDGFFASDVNLNNINEYIEVRNVPVGYTPQYIIYAQDRVEENGKIQDYGLVTIKVKLNAHFNNLGQLVQGEWTYPKTIEIKTKPFLNTSVAFNPEEPDVINARDLKSYVPSLVNDNVLQDTIYKSMSQCPNTFTANDITITNRTPDDEKGSITVDFSITNYYDNGVISKNPKAFSNVVITGFATQESKKADPFYKEIWFWILTGVSALSLVILLIVFISVKARGRKEDYWY